MNDHTPTPPAAPTTPDIADERVRELERDLNRLRGLIWAEVARLEGPPQAKTGEWGGKHWAEGVNVARRVGARELRAALATPSTPGAGQGRVSGPPWPSGCRSGAGDGLAMDDAPLACAYCDKVCQLRPAEPATGQGEPS